MSKSFEGFETGPFSPPPAAPPSDVQARAHTAIVRHAMGLPPASAEAPINIAQPDPNREAVFRAMTGLPQKGSGHE